MTTKNKLTKKIKNIPNLQTWNTQIGTWLYISTFVNRYVSLICKRMLKYANITYIYLRKFSKKSVLEFIFKFKDDGLNHFKDDGVVNLYS